jgi:hypothetical protein
VRTPRFLQVQQAPPLPLAAVVVFVLVCCLYFMTYSGRLENSGDTRALFNAVGSFVHYGDFLLDRSSYLNPPPASTPQSLYPLTTVDVEPLQVLLTAPLYWIAENVPQLGLAHTVWIFNILVGSFTAVGILLLARTLGYDIGVGFTAALLFAAGTIYWPYSKTFFREPLAGLTILYGVLFLERWRRSDYKHWRWMLLAVIFLGGAILTKEAVLFAVPGLVALIMPGAVFSRLDRPKLKWAGMVLILIPVWALLGLIVLSGFIPLTVVVSQVGAWMGRSAADVQTMLNALHTYLLSIGGSIWGTSPVLLLAIPGLYRWCKTGSFRYSFVILLVLMGAGVGYTVLRGEHWFGGFSWPPRFLVPFVPLMMLGTLPMIQLLFTRHRLRRFSVIVVTGIALYGVWVQLAGVSLDGGVYPALLPPEAAGLIEWGGGLNTIRFLRWVLIPSAWGTQALDFAWVRVPNAMWPVGLVVIVVLCVAALRVRAGRYQMWLAAALPLLLTGWVGLCLRSIYADENYQGSNQALHEVMAELRQSGEPGDVLLLSNNEYELFMLNYGKLVHPRIITLSDPLVDQLADVPADPSRSDAEQFLQQLSVGVIHNLASPRSRMWLLENFGVWHPWALRPVERLLATHYYPIREILTATSNPNVRLLEYSTVPAPDSFGFRGPDIRVNYSFGDRLELIGINLPLGVSYAVGADLPITFYWRGLDSIAISYTIAWFLVNDQQEVVVQGMDSQPQAGFFPTTSWMPGETVLDQRAVTLDVMPGEYQIWVRVYESNAPEQILPVEGFTLMDGTIAALPVTIRVTTD